MKIVHGLEEGRSLLRRQEWRPEAGPEALARLSSLFGNKVGTEQAVGLIIQDVRNRRDAALLHYAKELDGVQLEELEVPRSQIKSARSRVDPKVMKALELAAERIRAFHQRQKREPWADLSEGHVGQVIRPLGKVGIYAPGGRATYPSTVLMTAVPAKVAGVPEVFLATPPQREGDIPALILAAAETAGVDRLFRMGGAQAIAALAYGTESVPRVDKVCGPGNVFVTLAKKLVYGDVAIDGLQGPSEAMVVADDTADPAFCAADLLAQAEHDIMASAILITTSQELAARVNEEVERQLASFDGAASIASALEGQGAVVVVGSLDEAVELVNEYAPEHLSLMVQDPWHLVPKVRNAGAIFLGSASSAALGDYMVGVNHVLPTGGTARFASPLGVEDFIVATNIVAMDPDAVAELAQQAATIAEAEGLKAHARAITIRLTRPL